MGAVEQGECGASPALFNSLSTDEFESSLVEGEDPESEELLVSVPVGLALQELDSRVGALCLPGDRC